MSDPMRCPRDTRSTVGAARGVRAAYTIVAIAAAGVLPLMPAASQTAIEAQDQGGHFAAWEQPELLVSDLRAAFKELR